MNADPRGWWWSKTRLCSRWELVDPCGAFGEAEWRGGQSTEGPAAEWNGISRWAIHQFHRYAADAVLLSFGADTLTWEGASDSPSVCLVVYPVLDRETTETNPGAFGSTGQCATWGGGLWWVWLQFSPWENPGNDPAVKIVILDLVMIAISTEANQSFTSNPKNFLDFITTEDLINKFLDDFLQPIRRVYFDTSQGNRVLEEHW